jgi:hypothetical protein
MAEFSSSTRAGRLSHGVSSNEFFPRESRIRGRWVPSTETLGRDKGRRLQKSLDLFRVEDVLTAAPLESVDSINAYQSFGLLNKEVRNA